MRYLAIALLAVGMAACTDSTSPNGSVRGTFDLRTVNGSDLPIPLNNGCQLTSDQLAIRSDGSYEEDFNCSDPSFDDFDTGTYSVTNNVVDFFSDRGAGTFTGSVSGNVLTIQIPNQFSGSDVWVYQRE
jgi:hypothetical protein